MPDCGDEKSKADNAVETIQDRIHYLETEVERIKELVVAQDKRNGTVTTRVAIERRRRDGVPVCIVTCPAGDEVKIQRAALAAYSVMAWQILGSMLEHIEPNTDIDEAAAEVFGEARPAPTSKDMLERIARFERQYLEVAGWKEVFGAGLWNHPDGSSETFVNALEIQRRRDGYGDPT